jgi:hypothetical protein
MADLLVDPTNKHTGRGIYFLIRQTKKRMADLLADPTNKKPDGGFTC